MMIHYYEDNKDIRMYHTYKSIRVLMDTVLCTFLLSLSICTRGSEIEVYNSPANISKQPSEEDKKIKLPEPGKPDSIKPFKDYKKIVDCSILMLAGEDFDNGIQDLLFWSLNICKGKPAPFNKEGKPIDKPYNPFVVIASMSLTFNLFSKKYDAENLLGTLKILDLEAYRSLKGTFAIFIPHDYDKKWLNNNLKPLTVEDIKSYKIKKEPLDIDDLESIFSKKDMADTALCVHLAGHGKYKEEIADMPKDIYLNFLKILNDLNTQFLYVVTCFSGGQTGLIMHSPLEKSLVGSLEPEKEKKEFHVENLNFPIVVNATTDEEVSVPSYRYVKGTTDEYAFNTFFGTLHAYLRSPTWDVGMTRKEWHEKHGSGPLVLMKDVLKPLFLTEPVIQNLPSIFIPDHLVEGGIFFEAVKVDHMTIITSNIFEKLKAIKSKIEISDKSKYVLIYPVDMSEMTFDLSKIGSFNPPAFISKIGGNAYHIIGTFSAQGCKVNNLIEKSFLYGMGDTPFLGAMGVSHKAWLIKKLITSDNVWNYVVIYKFSGKGVSLLGDKIWGKGTCYLVFYQQDTNKKWYAMPINVVGDKLSFDNPIEISEAYYTSLLGKFKDWCTPKDPVAILKFTNGKESIETTQKAFEKFASSAVKFPIKCNPKDETKQIQKVYLALKEPNLIIMGAKNLLKALESSGKLDNDTLDKIKKLNEVVQTRSIDSYPLQWTEEPFK